MSQQIMYEITDTNVNVRTGVSGKTGQNYSIREQYAYMHKPGLTYPERIKVMLGDNKPAYAIGNYDLHPDSFFVDRFGGLACRPVLVARPAETARKVG